MALSWAGPSVAYCSCATVACSNFSVSGPSGGRCPDMALEHHVLNCNGCVDAKPFLELNTATLEFGALASPYAPLAFAFNASHVEPIHGIGNHFLTLRLVSFRVRRISVACEQICRARF